MNMALWLLWPAYGIGQVIIFCPVVSIFLSSFFPAYSQWSEIGCLPYFYTWCGLTANLECRSEMCCMRLAGSTGRKNDAKRSPSVHHRTTLSGCVFATKAFVDNRKKLIKQQYVLYMPPQYVELRPTNGWDRFGSLGHPSKFQRVSHLAFVTAAISLTGSQPNFARCLAVYLAGALYIHFRGLLPLTDFCQVQNSLYVQVSCSCILAALLHGTSAAGVSQTLRRGTRNGIVELLQRTPPIFGRVAITLHIGPHSSFCYFQFKR